MLRNQILTEWENLKTKFTDLKVRFELSIKIRDNQAKTIDLLKLQRANLIQNLAQAIKWDEQKLKEKIAQYLNEIKKTITDDSKNDDMPGSWNN